VRTCPLCGGEPSVTGSRYSEFSRREFHYGVCSACDLGLVVDPREDYENLYDAEYYAGSGADPLVDYLDEMRDPATIRNLEWRGLSELLGPLDRELRVLDFGCGLGGLPRYLQRAGWDAVGFEDEGFAKEWMNSHGLRTVDELKPESFDVIFAVEVVEHLVDPLPVLRSLRDSLRPGGRLIITTGNMARAQKPLHQWPYASVPEVHVTFWTPRSWAEALQKSGLIPVARTAALPASITQYKVLKSLPAGARPLGRVAPLWKPLARVVDRRYGVSGFADGLLPA
jgi:2-polyprenyl-3-methyl-5-hydroxy-6-metoxy-1,4-benzoquinol methylase